MERKKNKPSRKKPPVERTPAQEVVYTPPVPLNRRKFLLRLATVVAVVVAIFISCTIFFRADQIVVSGTERYTAWSVKEASGIQEGESLLSFGKATAAGRIMENLRYIKSVRVGITLPDTVNIYVEELEVVYSVQDSQDRWWLMSAAGQVVEQVNEEEAQEHTLLTGFRIDSPKAGQTAVAWEPEPETTEEQMTTVVLNAQRLAAAQIVAAQLERNEILGEAASVDATDPRSIQLWYGTQYQVRLGDSTEMERKIAMMKSVIAQHEQEGGHQSGVLDISLTTHPNSVPYTPF